MIMFLKIIKILTKLFNPTSKPKIGFEYNLNRVKLKRKKSNNHYFDRKYYMYAPNKNMEMPIISTKETPRNESCPCGSGKKYKKCCGNRATE